jgi:hypothetical protein
MRVLLSLCLSYSGFSIFAGNAAKHRIPPLVVTTCECSSSSRIPYFIEFNT